MGCLGGFHFGKDCSSTVSSRGTGLDNILISILVLFDEKYYRSLSLFVLEINAQDSISNIMPKG